jgi:outer membrane protein assembly factor BamB
MAIASARQQGSRLYLWLVGGLIVAGGLYAAYQYFYGSHFVSDPDLMRELSTASLNNSATADVPSGTWPQWRGPNRDGISHETGWLTHWPKNGLRLLWKKSAGSGYSAVAVANGRVFTMGRNDDSEEVICWDAGSGKEKWRQKYAAPISGDRRFDTGYGDGPRSTPTVDGNFVYTVGATGLMHCWDAVSGKPIWDRDLFADGRPQKLGWGISFSPLIQGKLIFTNPGGSNGHALVALNKTTGKVVWHQLDDAAGYSSPMPMTVAGIPQVIFFTANGLVSADPATGHVLWQFPWETEFLCNIATPIIAGNYVFISTGYQRGCAVIKGSKAGDGKLKAERVYEGKNYYCNHFSTSVLYKDYLYGFNETLLTCMNFRTGDIVWKQKGFRKGSLMIADGYLIVLSDQGKLAIAPATPDGYKEISNFTVTKNKTWTVPVLADGKLFIRDESDLYCFDVSKPN